MGIKQLITLLFLYAIISNPIKAAPSPIIGIGIISASNSEEYQTIPIRYNNDNTIKPFIINWMEILAREGYPFGEYRENSPAWPSTANYGYQYNWAKSGATSQDAITQQQHQNLATQIQQGKVSHVVISIGANDFNPFLSPQNNNGFIRLYNGSDSIQTRVDQVYGNIKSITDTILAAEPAVIIINQIPNPFQEPQIQTMFPNEIGKARVTQAIEQINQAISTDADNNPVIGVTNTINSLNSYLLGERSNSQGFLFGTKQYQIYTNRLGFDGQSYRLDDDIGHPGTVLSGIEANGIFIQVLNDQFGYNLPYISEDKILGYAGVIAMPTSTPNSSDQDFDSDIDYLDYLGLVEKLKNKLISIFPVNLFLQQLYP